MKWLKERLTEKTTLSAIIGLIAALLPYTGIPEDIRLPTITLISTILMSFVVTKG